MWTHRSFCNERVTRRDLGNRTRVTPVDRAHTGRGPSLNFVRRPFRLLHGLFSCINHNLHYIDAYSNHIIEHSCLANLVWACWFVEFRRWIVHAQNELLNRSDTQLLTSALLTRLFQTNDWKNDLQYRIRTFLHVWNVRCPIVVSFNGRVIRGTKWSFIRTEIKPGRLNDLLSTTS